jgi:hypothetical protein
MLLVSKILSIASSPVYRDRKYRYPKCPVKSSFSDLKPTTSSSRRFEPNVYWLARRGFVTDAFCGLQIEKNINEVDFFKNYASLFDSIVKFRCQ